MSLEARKNSTELPTYEVVDLSQRHLTPDLFTHGNEGYSKYSKGLERIVSLLFLLVLPAFCWCTDVVITMMQHSLDLEHVARPCVRTRFD